MKKFVLTGVLIGLAAFFGQAQTPPMLSEPASSASGRKAAVYGEFGLGFGQTLFFGDMKEKLFEAYGGSFNPGIGNNLMMGFYVAPDCWMGLGIGTRIKGTFGTSVKGDNGNSFIFNYYNLAATAKYYGVSGKFNKGLYIRGSFGFGQFTTKRVDEERRLYKHQYAIGTSLMGGLGYTFNINKITLSVETEFDYSNRNGTIDGKGEARFQSGQIGGNIILSF